MSGEMDDDAQLMLACRDGDPRAFETLFRRYSTRLVSFLARMVPERAKAEELAQDVFVRIYQARERYEPTARFSTYLFGIASNLALNELARAHRKRERPFPEDGEIRVAAAAPSAEEEIAHRRTREHLEEALDELPARQRAALLLRVDEGLGYEEIAAALDTSVSSVKSLIHRARCELLESLESREAGEPSPSRAASPERKRMS
jgi:RNA polymerase sigma-70 factor (ECF subfamily)